MRVGPWQCAVVVAGILVMGLGTREVKAQSTEELKQRIQELERRACGYRNRDRFRNAIYFHLGGLDLYPVAAPNAHTTS